MFFSHRCCVLPLPRGGPSSISQVAHSPILQNAALSAPNRAGDGTCDFARASWGRTAFPGSQGKGGPRVGAGVPHRAELSSSLCEAVFSHARMPALTTEAEYHLLKPQLHGRQGLAALDKFWLNLGAHEVGEGDRDAA